MVSKKKLVVICGPTAVGKTAIGIEVAKTFNTVVLNSDSRQIYKELNIGVAKPSEEELSAVQHFLIGAHSVTELYGAGDFEKEALKLLNDMFKTTNVVVVVGGTGLYLKALYEGLDDLPGADEVYRAKLKQVFEEKGIQVLQELLMQKDSEAMETIDKQNPQRLMRALEIIHLSGKKYSDLLLSKKANRPFDILKIGLNLPREELYSRINSRVDKMMEDGLLKEVKSLEVFRNNNALKTVGYKELFDYLDGNLSLTEAVEKIKQHTRNYAKRQITWFKSDEEVKWFEPTQMDAIKSYIELKVK